MADYDLQYQDTYVDALLATANELKTAGYIYKGVATPSTNPGTPTERVAYLASEPGTYTNFGGIVIASGLYSLTYSGGTWTGTQMQAVSDVEVRNTPVSDLDIMDESGNILVRFEGGGAKTKNFDSSKTTEIGDDNFADLDIIDGNEYVLARFYDGHIKTKKFDSKKYEDLDFNHWKGKKWYGFGTSITNVSGEGKYATYLAQISKMTFVNKGHSGGGITTSSNQSIYNDIMTSNLNDADLITLEVGANDEGAALGTIYDGLPNSTIIDNSTLCGALNLCIRHLQANTNAQIVVMCSPSARKSVDGSRTYYGNETRGLDNHTEIERNEAIRQVCMLNSCYFIGAGCEDGMGFARMNASNNYNVDQIHHTNLGGYNFAQAIWSKLKNIPLFYTSIPQ